MPLPRPAPEVEDFMEGRFFTFGRLARHFENTAEKQIDMSSCYWGDGDDRLWSRCNGNFNCTHHCEVPRPPPSVDLIGIRLVGNVSPLPIARWINHSQNPFLKVDLDIQFEMWDGSHFDASDALRILGTRLIRVMFDVTIVHGWNNFMQERLYPSLMANTELESFSLRNIIPSVCPPNYLASVFSKISSVKLTRIELIFIIDEMDDVLLRELDLKAFEAVLFPEGRLKFPLLSEVTVYAAPGSLQPPSALRIDIFEESFMSKLPRLMASEDIDISIEGTNVNE
ncbi:hypothetical protein BDY19DRAFT_1048977 [Irpex rosettiformis]|uniref:Uncharacterized protein n=1 Tax=Irpex rosettiformis TaxID=378272 RepID=A0ACB8U1M6_9APHY|nr:hypothetical protein BDY19DRAFT_1048977 [Irpex rosettiformis]